MGVRVKDNSQFKEIYVKALDSMPVGTIVDYVGQASDIPVGWEQVSGQNKIQKTSETRPLASHTVNAYSESESNAYSCDYSNKAFGKTILFENLNGQTGNLTLNDDIENYEYYEIIPYGNNGISIKNKVGNASIFFSQQCDGAYLYPGTIRFRLSGKTLIKDQIYSWYGPISSPYQNKSTTDWFSIAQIIGYGKKTNTSQSTRSLNTYSGDIEEKKDIVVDDGGEEKPIDDRNDENNK